MKKRLVSLLAISVILLATGSASAVTVMLEPPIQSVAPCTIFTVEVLVIDVQPPGVDTFNLVLSFDPTQMEALGVQSEDVNIPSVYTLDMLIDLDPWPGTEVAGYDESFAMFGPELDNVNGQVSFTLWNVGSLGAVGCGTAAILTFHCLAEGTSQIEFTSWLLEPVTGEAICHDDIGATVVQETIVPEPATLMLVAAGLAALGSYARKKSR